MDRFRFWAVAAVCLWGLGGCSSVAKGVTEAVLEHQNEQEDTRQCEIEGEAFDGIRQSLDSQNVGGAKTTKVLMVHGIADHLPGYSARFQKKLYDRLGLNVTDETAKTILLDSPDITWRKDEPHTLGSLRVTRHANADGSRQLIFYELTWSPITAGQKQALETDSANNEGLRRATLNGSLKRFLNATVPDLLIYNGNGYDKITASVAESVCWMLADDWAALPDGGAHGCAAWKGSTFATLAEDDHFFVTHSLGSRIAIDMIQHFAMAGRKGGHDARLRRVEKTARDKAFTVFMMANQLPLLQMGRDPPAMTGADKAYCGADAPKAASRVVRRLNLIAFSDPNDLLSYPIPMDFTSSRIDSRLCPSVTNVSLNVADERNLFDAVSFANPLTAHSGYMEDDRVIALIAEGLRRANGSQPIADRCSWRETVSAKTNLSPKATADESLQWPE